MNLKEQINEDLKQAMLSGKKETVTTLRGLKGAILNVEIATNSRDSGLSDEETIKLLSKESKKRLESAELYKQANEQARATSELNEKKIIDKYLPEKLSAEELSSIVDDTLAEFGEASPADMGKLIGLVRNKVGAGAEGATIAKIVKEKLTK